MHGKFNCITVNFKKTVAVWYVEMCRGKKRCYSTLGYYHQIGESQNKHGNIGRSSMQFTKSSNEVQTFCDIYYWGLAGSAIGDLLAWQLEEKYFENVCHDCQDNYFGHVLTIWKPDLSCIWMTTLVWVQLKCLNKKIATNQNSKVMIK